MSSWIISVGAQVVELAIFFGAASALAIGVLGLR
jgi:hypothetical protein